MASGEEFTGPQKISLICDVEDARIHYTIDGTKVNSTSPVYSEPFIIAENTTVQVISVIEGKMGILVPTPLLPILLFI